jgi:hypothetical protein
LIAWPVSTMFASCCLKTWNEIAGTPSTREIESGSRSRSTTGAEVGEADHHAVTTGDDDVGERLRVPHLAFDAHDRVFLGAGEQADRHVGIGALQRLRHVAGRQLVGAQALRIEVDPHLAHRQAADVDPATPVERSRRFLTTWSASSDSSRALRSLLSRER